MRTVAIVHPGKVGDRADAQARLAALAAAAGHDMPEWVETTADDPGPGQARAALASAIAHEKLARSTAARWNDLLTSSSVSKQEVDEKNGDLAVKAAGVAEAILTPVPTDGAGALDGLAAVLA